MAYFKTTLFIKLIDYYAPLNSWIHINQIVHHAFVNQTVPFIRGMQPKITIYYYNKI